ncbi:MAG: [FeFe] hydrogenase H-cluster radical SAM maturase HydG [Clostridia bacterium]|nr:[FeFe] hydrogenase H-cluster radical SAM maturase HydG [Clostridia bacterium]
MFIKHDYIEKLIQTSANPTAEKVSEILDRAARKEGLTHQDIATLLHVEDPVAIKRMYDIAGQLKRDIYGNRIVVFAPLYISNYCVNNCTYCGYKHSNDIPRRKLSREEIQQEVMTLEKMGHKRLALEVGEDPVNCDIDYVVDAIDAIYTTKNDNGSIRRINVNVAATTVENYRKLKAADIGTYILFQETYHEPTYKAVHPKSVKGNYEYHLTAFDRAMEAGIDDVGGGVLFGLADHMFEVIALMMHNEHLEEAWGVGFHTISVPRLKKAEGMDLDQFPHIIDDETFKKIVAIIRIAVPFTGIILSTRESQEMRKEVLRYGVSQISAGSCTGVGGYKEQELLGKRTDQFTVADERSPLEVLKELVTDGYIPSYCTACYRQGRTGDRFMQLAKSGSIQHVCQPNAMMTLMEFMLDYGDEEILKMGQALIQKEIENIQRVDIKELVINNIEKLKKGERDIYL